MLSLRAHTSIAAVMNYYAATDYYLGADADASAAQTAAQWFGQGAEHLGLDGPVGRGEFQRLLEGKLPDGSQLGTYRNGELEHRPCWDLTFSAPKSVSVLALVGGDARLLEAHDQSVRAALTYLESRVAETRIREGGVLHSEATGNLIVATMREDTSRAADPQLHSHNVVMNATRSADGQWRSLDGYQFFLAQRELGQLYRNELALRAQALGYQVVPGKDGTFELAGVSKAVLQEFSTRSGQVEQALADKGLTRETATPAQKDVATLATRATKQDQSAEQLGDGWQRRAAQHGFDGPALVAAARREASSSLEPGRNDAAAALAVESAIAKLSEREAVFTERALRQEAMQAAVGKARFSDVERAVVGAVGKQDLIERHIDRDGRQLAGFTTRQGIQTEERLLAAELSGRNGIHPLLTERGAHQVVAQHELRGEHTWTQGQRLATAALLSSRHRVNGLQGFAGTAKTTTVINSVSHVAWRQGHQVIALAPTASAAETLGNALNRPAMTVSRHLAELERSDHAAGKPQLWVVDEASLLSARQMAQLLEGAKQSDARVLLVGDVQQLGSVDAGAAFRQLQDAGMRAAVLDEIVRQTNDHAKESVYAAIRGDARAAIAAIERGGGQVWELPEAADRHAAIARDYADLSPRERDRTLVLDPSREGREALTAAVRDSLKQDGTLHGPSVRVETMEDKRLTREEAKQAYNYEAGDRVRFRGDYAAGIAKGEYYRVTGVDAQAGTVALASRDGQAITWTPAKWGSATVEAYTVAEREVMTGDRIAWTRNDTTAGRVNGHTAEVTRIGADGSITVRDHRGSQTIDPAKDGDGHFRHAYVLTVHAAQGQTADRVMINAESFRTNLLNERSFYVAISRAREDIRVYTDNVENLTRGVEERTGEKTAALDQRSAAKTAGAEVTRDDRGTERSDRSHGR